MAGTAAGKDRTPVVVNTLSMTLDELDTVEELVNAGAGKRMAALVHVWCKSRRTRLGEVPIDQAGRLTFRDVRIVERLEEDEEAVPTSARS